MLGEKLSRALDGIPDAQLQSAMGVYERKKKLKYIWVRVVLAVILLAIVIWLLATQTTSVGEESTAPESAQAQSSTIMQMEKGTAKSRSFCYLFRYQPVPSARGPDRLLPKGGQPRQSGQTQQWEHRWAGAGSDGG